MEFTPRTYTRGTLVTEEDRRDWKFRFILTAVASSLVAADLMIEFGTGSAEVAAGNTLTTGYSLTGGSSLIETRQVGQGIWAPTTRTPNRLNVTYDVGEKMSLYDENNTLDERAWNIFLEHRSGAIAGFQPLIADTPSEQILAGSGDEIWFQGGSGTIIVRGSEVIYCDWYFAYRLTQQDYRGHPSIAILEMLTSGVWSTHIRLTRLLYQIDPFSVTIELNSLPVIAVDCDTTPEYPDAWGVECINGKTRLGEFRRHDRVQTDDKDTVLRSYNITVEYGERVQPREELELLKHTKFIPAGSSSRRTDIVLLWGEGLEVIRSLSFELKLYTEGVSSVICIKFIEVKDLDGGEECRRRDWADPTERAAAFQALQISLANRRHLRDIFEVWSSSGNASALTQVLWISEALSDHRGTLLSDVKTVATLNNYFIIGVTIIFISFMAGVINLVVHWRLGRENPESCRYLTLESSRRIAVMSARSRYNCSQIPNRAPITAILRSGDFTCHLSTSYSEQPESLSLPACRKEGLLLMGWSNTSLGGHLADVVRTAAGRASSRLRRGLSNGHCSESAGSQPPRLQLRADPSEK